MMPREEEGTRKQRDEGQLGGEIGLRHAAAYGDHIASNNRHQQQRVGDHGRAESAICHQQVPQERHGKNANDRNADRVPGVTEFGERSSTRHRLPPILPWCRRTSRGGRSIRSF